MVQAQEVSHLAMAAHRQSCTTHWQKAPGCSRVHHRQREIIVKFVAGRASTLPGATELPRLIRTDDNSILLQTHRRVKSWPVQTALCDHVLTWSGHQRATTRTHSCHLSRLGPSCQLAIMPRSTRRTEYTLAAAEQPLEPYYPTFFVVSQRVALPWTP